MRAKDDAAATVSLVRTQWLRKDVPPYLVVTLEAWLLDAKAWQAEGFSAAKQTPLAPFERARALIDTAGARDLLLAREADRVKLLRATAYLSLALEKQPSAPWRGEALYLLGVATTAVQDPDLWELDGLYLEACVRENPHTPLAMRCADRLVERTVFGFTGSGGTRLPGDVAAHLERVRALAR